MRQRNHTFDLLCGLCIVRMMMNHAIAMCGLRWQAVGGVTWYDLMSWTYFFMCFFFFKAGYFNRTAGSDSWQYCKDRFRRLIVPYIVWSIVGAIVYFGMITIFPYTFDARHMASFDINHLWQTAHSYGNGPCWFLVSFFTAYIIIHFIRRVPHLHWVILLFPAMSYGLYLVGSPLPLSLDNVFMGVFFFSLGHVWRVFMTRMTRSQTIGLSVGLILLFVAVNILWHGEYTMSTNQWDGNPLGTVVATTCILCGLSGLLLSLPQRRVPVLGYIGQHSMVYFVAHYPLMYFYIFTHRAAHSTYKQNWGECLLLILFMLVVCTWLVPYVERSPWLSGRIQKAKTDSA